MAYIGQPHTGAPDDISAGGSSLSTGSDTTYTSTPCDSRCLCGNYYSFVAFTNLSIPPPRPNYYIGTTWRIFYPSQIRQALDRAGFQVLDSDYPSCGYTLKDTTSGLGIVRGWYGINGTSSQPDGQPYIGAVVESLLRESYPYVEVYLLASTLLFPVLLLSIIISTYCLSLVLRSRADPHRVKKRKRSRKRNPATIKKLRVRVSQWKLLSKWMSKPPPHIAKLPVELQQHVISYLDHHSAVNLRHTSRYYNQIISLADIPALRVRNAENGLIGASQQVRSCSRCLGLLPTPRFEANQLAPGVGSRERRCFRCSLRGDGYRHGGIIRGQLFCVQCRKFKSRSEAFPEVSSNWALDSEGQTWRWCRECHNRRSGIGDVNLLIRLPQLLTALIVCGLANSGSVPARFWTWVWLAALFWTTIYYMVGAICYRVVAQLTRVSIEPLVFGLVVTIAWAGVAIRLTYEATRPDQPWPVPYNAHNKALMAFCYIEAVLFILDFLFITTRFQLLWLASRRKFNQNTITYADSLLN